MQENDTRGMFFAGDDAASDHKEPRWWGRWLALLSVAVSSVTVNGILFVYLVKGGVR